MIFYHNMALRQIWWFWNCRANSQDCGTTRYLDMAKNSH